jgi:hypothetical protein
VKEWLSKRNTLEKVALGIGAVLVVLVVIGLVAGDSEPTYDNRKPTETPKTSADKADTYAYALAGDRSGCSQGEASGCVYAAAYSACLEALEGRDFDSPTYRQQFPEAEYFAAAKTAYADCSKPDGWNPQGS